MEKPQKPKNLFLKFLPKAVNFQNTPFSQGRDHHHSNTKLKAHAYKGFSGPINFAVLPEEAREKPKDESYDSQEPTSPKVSCMGQIKYKHKNKKKLLKAAKKNNSTPSEDYNDNQHKQGVKSNEVKKSGSAISKLFSRSPKTADSRSKVAKVSIRSHHAENNKMLPSLGQMRKFASGRDSLANFDWTAQIAPIDHDRDCFSDEERIRESDDEDEEKEIIIPFSAPILLSERVGFEPRKEVNLWKRRTMNPPPPLSLIPKVR